MKKLIFLLCVSCFLAGCADTKKVAPKEGRIAIKASSAVSVEKSSTDVQVAPVADKIDWQQNNANAQNLMPHGKLPKNAAEKWQRNIGKGITSSRLILPEPITHDGVIYALDSAFRLSAVREADGQKIWRVDLPMDKEMSLASIGLGADKDRLYVIGGNGMIYALDFSGTVQWQKNAQAILRSAPTIYRDKLYVMSANNEIFAFNTADGELVWKYRNISTVTNLMGMGQPAAADHIVVVPFASGEIIAFDADTGTMLWSDTLLSSFTFNQIQDISHVRAAPVIAGKTVYLVGNALKTAAFDLKTGALKFMQNIGGQNTPVVSGNALFLITNQNTLVALDKSSGKLIWETALTAEETQKIFWSGPLLVNNALVCVSNKGDILLFDAQSGKLDQHMRDKNLINKPILGNNRLIFLTDDADLIVYE